jgi:hypothetical protein
MDAMRIDRQHLRRVGLFTAAFVMLPMAAFAMVLFGMLWRRFAGIA